MDIEERMDRLEDAHRALAAKYTGLVAVSRVMLPLIDADPALVRRLLMSAYDIYSEHMAAAGQDDEYQEAVRDEIDRVSRSILAGVESRQRHARNPPSTPE